MKQPPKKVLILGATSTIARAIAEDMAELGWNLLLAGRDLEELKRLQGDLRTRYDAIAHVATLEAEHFLDHAQFVESAIQELGGIDGAVFAIGELGEQPADSQDPSRARQLVDVNLTAAVSLLAILANELEKSGGGFLIGLASVAGDRGRKSNYVYGAAKAGLATFLQGLRNRCESANVRVYTVKPGFVDTQMTYGKQGMFLVARPEKVARSVVKLLDRPSGVYYLPGFWRWIMLAIRLIPERIFKRLSL